MPRASAKGRGENRGELLRIHQVMQLPGLSRMTIYRLGELVPALATEAPTREPQLLRGESFCVSH
jgi:hypothetical protein